VSQPFQTGILLLDYRSRIRAAKGKPIDDAALRFVSSRGMVVPNGRHSRPSPLHDMLQAREGREVLADNPGSHLRSQVKDRRLAGLGLIRLDVENREPARMLQVQRIQHRVADVRQALPGGRHSDHHVPRRVAGRRDGGDAGHDLALSPEQGDPLPDRFQVVTGAGSEPLRGFGRSKLQEPKLPLIPPDVVVNVDINGPAIRIARAASSDSSAVRGENTRSIDQSPEPVRLEPEQSRVSGKKGRSSCHTSRGSRVDVGHRHTPFLVASRLSRFLCPADLGPRRVPTGTSAAQASFLRELSAPGRRFA